MQTKSKPTGDVAVSTFQGGDTEKTKRWQSQRTIWTLDPCPALYLRRSLLSVATHARLVWRGCGGLCPHLPCHCRGSGITDTHYRQLTWFWVSKLRASPCVLSHWAIFPAFSPQQYCLQIHPERSWLEGQLASPTPPDSWEKVWNSYL